jgi:glycosyltransferase involved in cell wall biosynthesis
MDDGSTDGSEELITKWPDQRIRYFKFEHTGIASRLRNFGIEQSKGKYIAFLDSDDVWFPEKIQQQVNALKNYPGSGFTFTNVIEFANNNTTVKQGIYKQWNKSFEGKIFNSYVQNEFVIYPSSFLFDKECISTTGKLNELFPWTDNDFFHRLAYHFKGFVIVDALVKIRKHEGNTSSTLAQEMVKEMHHMLAAFFNKGMITEPVFLKMTAHYYYLSGMLYLRSAQKKPARNAFLNCTLYNPFRFKAWIRIIFSFLNIPQTT